MKKVRLIRGWEAKYLPGTRGEVRLSKPQVYRAIGEEDGIGDVREGEVRLRNQGTVTLKTQSTEEYPEWITKKMRDHADDETIDQWRLRVSQQTDDPNLRMEKKNSEKWIQHQNVKIDDSALSSPYIFCLAREPATKASWDQLRNALSRRYDAWTVTEDVDKLRFEIQCGVKRWIALNHIARHRIESHMGWVAYPYDEIPPSKSTHDVMQELMHMRRWFRKRRKYQGQNEFRLAWRIHAPEWKNLPEAIEVELTTTGLQLFKPWEPPEE